MADNQASHMSQLPLDQKVLLTTKYKSPGDSWDLESRIRSMPTPSSSSSPSPAEKAAYLSQLRSTITTVQTEINRELTRRMEEDKLRAAADAAGAGGPSSTTTSSTSKKPTPVPVVDDAKEEENYGEEVPENE